MLVYGHLMAAVILVQQYGMAVDTFNLVNDAHLEHIVFIFGMGVEGWEKWLVRHIIVIGVSYLHTSLHSEAVGKMKQATLRQWTL